jgi:hypothetical protein
MSAQRPIDIVEQLTLVKASVAGHGVFPQWFLDLEKMPGRSMGWQTLFADAIAEIERARKGEEELEQMKQLAGRLMRRLTDGSDLPLVEAWAKATEER